MSLSPETTRLLKDLDSIMSGAKEELTGGITNINSDHAIIHSGQGYGFYAAKLDLGASTAYAYSFRTPADLYVHLKNLGLQVIGSSVKLELLEGVTITVDTGAATAVNNLNRNSSNTAGTTIKAAPTYSGGTVISTVYALADSTRQTTASSNLAQNANEELVLEPDSDYVVLLTNLTANTTGYYIAGYMYEESQGLST